MSNLAPFARRCRAPSRLARAALVALTATSAALLLIAPAAAISRQQAEQVALERLQPAERASDVIVFGLRRPLPARASVHEWGPVTRALKRPGRRAWLFWADLEPDAAYQHASRAVLVDDRSGRIVTDAALTYFPLVNGKPPPFLRSADAYESGRYHVFDGGAPTDSSARARGRRVGVPAGSLPAGVVAGECLLLIVATPPNPIQEERYRNVIAGWSDLATSLGIPAFVGTTAGPVQVNGLPGAQAPAYREQVFSDVLPELFAKLVDDEHCRDIAVYVHGHGSPPPGWKDEAGQTHEGGPARILLGISPLTKAQLDQGTRRRAKRVTPEAFEAVVKAYAGRATFKFVVESCFAARFKDALVDEPNVKIVLASSSADEETYDLLYRARDEHGNRLRPDVPNPGRMEFSHGLIEGMLATLRDATELANVLALGDSFFARLLRTGFKRVAANDLAARTGRTHPVAMDNLVASPFGELSMWYWHPQPNPGYSFVCGRVPVAPGTSGTIQVTTPTGPLDPTPFTTEDSADGLVQFYVEITSGGHYSATVSSGTATVTAAIDVEAAQGTEICPPVSAG